MTETSNEPVYQLTENGVLRMLDKAFIPNCEENREWQAYQQWLAEGHTPAPAPAPPPDLTLALANGAARQQRTQKKERLLKQSELLTLKAEFETLKVTFYSQWTGD